MLTDSVQRSAIESAYDEKDLSVVPCEYEACDTILVQAGRPQNAVS